jgi:hypothetical protein
LNESAAMTQRFSLIALTGFALAAPLALSAQSSDRSRRPNFPSGVVTARVAGSCGELKCPLENKWTLQAPVFDGFQAAWLAG